MSSRLRILVKKRGTRRTGSRWQAILGAGLINAGMLLLGVYGFYWLTVHYLWIEAPDYGWWPWFLLLIPAALAIYGLVGVFTTAWESLASSERRAAAVRKASDWEIPGTDNRPAFPSLATIPPIEPIVESPGVRLAYRLPIDNASGWVSASMAIICLVLNVLVGVFLVQVVRQHLDAAESNVEPNWLLTWVMVPLVLAGIWTLFALARQILFSAAIGTTRVEVSDHPLFPGETYSCYVSQTGRLHVRWYQIQLVCQERAIYQQGTDTRVATHEVYRSILFSRRKFDIKPGEAFEAEAELPIPPEAMHSFVASHNAVRWTLIVKGRVRGWGEFERRFPIFVYPFAAAEALSQPRRRRNPVSIP